MGHGLVTGKPPRLGRCGSTQRNPHRDGLIRRSSALSVVIAQGDKCVGFRVIGGHRSGGDVVHHRGKALETQRNAGREHGLDVDHVAVFELAECKVRFVDEQHIPTAEYSSIPIVQPVNRGVVLIVTPNRGELERIGGGDLRYLPLGSQTR